MNYKKILFIALFLGFGAATLNAQELPKPYQAELNLIEENLRSGDLPSALAAIESLLANYPEAAEVHYAKSLLFAQVRNFESAIPAAQQAVALSQNRQFANHLLELYKVSNKLPEALVFVDQLIAQHPKDIGLRREKMILLLVSKQAQEALAVHDQAYAEFGASDTLAIIQSDILLSLQKKEEAQAVLEIWHNKKSTLRQVYSTLAQLYTEQSKDKQAIQVVLDGLVHSKDELLYFDLADAYASVHKDKLAFEALKSAFTSSNIEYGNKHRVMYSLLSGTAKLSLDQVQELANTLVLQHPRIADTHLAKGELLWRRGHPQEARSLFLTAIGINPNHIDAWRVLINVEVALGDYKSAIDHGMEGLKANPKNSVLLYFTAMAHMVNKDMASARQLLEYALDHSGSESLYLQSLIYSGLGDLYHELKMHDASDVAYSEAISLDSTNASAMNNYAYYLAERKENLDLAAQYAEQANVLDPRSATFQDTYAWVLFRQGKYDKALLWIERAVKQDNPSAVLFDHYGDILFKVGKTKEAVKAWNKALAVGDAESISLDTLKLKISTRNYVE